MVLQIISRMFCLIDIVWSFLSGFVTSGNIPFSGTRLLQAAVVPKEGDCNRKGCAGLGNKNTTTGTPTYRNGREVQLVEKRGLLLGPRTNGNFHTPHRPVSVWIAAGSFRYFILIGEVFDWRYLQS